MEVVRLFNENVKTRADCALSLIQTMEDNNEN